MPVRTRGELWGRWFGWVTAGEFLGFLTPAAVGAASAAWPPAAMAVALLAAGAIEGALLGLAQAHVLRLVLPALARTRFVVATSAAAVAAYGIGLVPMLLGDRLGELPLPLLVVLAVIGGGLLLATIGTAQWLVLRAVLPRASVWIWTTAGAWAAGLLVFTAVATPLWQPGQPLWLLVLIGALGGLAMAATVAALTGLALVRLCPPGTLVPAPAADGPGEERPSARRADRPRSRR